MYLLITEVTVHIDGDERSRTHPGHGYPARDEHYQSVEKFEDHEIDKLIEKLKKLEPSRQRQKFTVYKATESKIEFNLQVKID